MILDLNGDETFSTVKQTVRWLHRHGVRIEQYSLLVAIPGTDLRRKAIKEQKLLTYDPRDLDGSKPTVLHQASPEERLSWLSWAYEATFPHSKPGWIIFITRLIIAMGYNPNVFRAAYHTIKHVRGSLDKWNKAGGFDSPTHDSIHAGG